jgi:hypothetical protein
MVVTLNKDADEKAKYSQEFDSLQFNGGLK